MRVLLDSHVLLWWASGDRRLSPRARRILRDRGTEPVWSAAGTWELAIKIGIGRLRSDLPLGALLEESYRRFGLDLLPVLDAHVLRVAGLPLHHRDPFDRMLVAQALEESLPLVSRDTALRAYGVEVVW